MQVGSMTSRAVDGIDRAIRLRRPGRGGQCSPRRAAFRPGAAVVEFAVVAPLLLLLTMGMMEIGRMVMVKQLLVNASREGARLAVLPGSTSEEVLAQVEQNLEASSVSGAQVVVEPSVISSSPVGTPITITVSIPATAVSWVPKPMFSFGNMLSASTTMRKEST